MAKKQVQIQGKQTEVHTSAEPRMVYFAEASETVSRRNRAATIERSDKYSNIEAGSLPFKNTTGYGGAELDAKEAVLLCQKAYFNVAIVRNIIDLMTEFSVGDIYFRDGNAATRDFISAWWSKINGAGFQDRYFREYYRSGNNFLFRFDTEIQPSDIRKIVSTFGFDSASGFTQLEVPKMMLPARYVILNPSDVLYGGGVSFYAGNYYKRLSDYELARLRNPKTDEDKEVLESLPPAIRKQIETKRVGTVNLPLNPEQVTAIFYKKQDYEPFACPMIYPVLEDLNFKIELKRLDMAIARTQQQVILLVTTGAEPEKGGINQENLAILQKLFQNESIGRVLVADYTTKAQFVIPEIAALLDPKKYEQLDKDINLGLNNILVGGEKFANQSTKVEVFLARLEHGRQIFLNEFLIPEVRRICKSLGFKSYPVPYYDEITLKNNDLRDKVYLRLAELGLLTPTETFIALETGRLPDAEASIEGQKEYKKSKTSGLYEPLIGGAKDKEGSAEGNGRPTGTGVPQMTKKITPIGASVNEEKYSMLKLMELMKASQELGKEVETLLKLKFKKNKLTKEQQAVAIQIAKIIVANEDPANWKEAVGEYTKKPVDKYPERISAIQAIAAEHGCDDYLASLLYLSKITPPTETKEA